VAYASLDEAAWIWLLAFEPLPFSDETAVGDMAEGFFLISEAVEDLGQEAPISSERKRCVGYTADSAVPDLSLGVSTIKHQSKDIS